MVRIYTQNTMAVSDNRQLTQGKALCWAFSLKVVSMTAVAKPVSTSSDTSTSLRAAGPVQSAWRLWASTAKAKWSYQPPPDGNLLGRKLAGAL